MPDDTTAKRIGAIRGLLHEQSLDALLVSQPESRFYLSGYSAHDLPPRDSAGYLLISADRLILLTDGRTIEQAKNEAPGYSPIEMPAGISNALPSIATDLGVRTIGFEGIHLPFHIAEEITAALAGKAELRETVGLIDVLRLHKDEQELEHLRSAIAVSDACVHHLLGFLRPGMTEREIAWEVEVFMRTHGADRLAFNTIVASGPNAALPHAVLTDRRVSPGEPIVIDMGATVSHYSSDITRTVCLGTPPEWLLEIYRLTLDAQVRAEEGIRPGMTGREADALARELISAAGYGEHFRHSLGHGIGLEEHEPPRVSARSDDVLETGMVFSVEPGIYLTGTGGVRIEDLAHLGPDSATVLTKAPKGLGLLRL